MAALHLRAESALYNPDPDSRYERDRSARKRRARVEAHIEALIEMLDQLDGDLDLEEDQEDCCDAYDDRLYSMGYMNTHPDFYGAGDPVDAEEDCHV